MKGVLFLWLLWDFGFSIRDYSLNEKEILNPVTDIKDDTPCVICFQLPNNPVALKCNHCFCRQCVSRWLKENNTCPICRRIAVEHKDIDFSDGYMPEFILFSPF